MAANTRFSTGVHALILLAIEPGKLQTSETLAGRLGTNPVVIRRIFSLLQQAELVVSHKGPTGGSKLARPARAITLKDIYKALDPGTLFHDGAIAATGTEATGKELARAYRAAEASMLHSLSGVTLHSIVKRATKKTK